MMHSIHNFLNDGLLQSFPPWKSQTIELRCVFCIRCQNSGLNNFRICSTVFKNRLRKNHHFCREGGLFWVSIMFEWCCATVRIADAFAFLIRYLQLTQ